MPQFTARKKIFILGVGAQKSGTTWLYEQLKKNPNINMGFMKEYHVFDALFSPQCSSYRDSIIETIKNRIIDKSLGVNSGDNLTKRLSFIDNTDNYFEYFDYLHSKNQAIEAVGDITPSYSMLSSNSFEYIKEGLESKGFTVKTIFLMRDPFERIWSMLRMMRQLELENGISPSRTESDIIEEFSKTEGCELRTRYENTAKNLEKAFKPDSIHYGLYESMFTTKGYEAISDFLNIELSAPDIETIINKSHRSENIHHSTIQRVVSHYRETYEFALNKFGRFAKSVWHGFEFY